jgi:hypothetical protein
MIVFSKEGKPAGIECSAGIVARAAALDLVLL